MSEKQKVLIEDLKIEPLSDEALLVVSGGFIVGNDCSSGFLCCCSCDQCSYPPDGNLRSS
jgi:hypothetical protein